MSPDLLSNAVWPLPPRDLAALCSLWMLRVRELWERLVGVTGGSRTHRDPGYPGPFSSDGEGRAEEVLEGRRFGLSGKQPSAVAHQSLGYALILKMLNNE